MKIFIARVFTLLFFTLVIHGSISCQNKKADRAVVWKETVGTLDPHDRVGTIHYLVNVEECKGSFVMKNEDAVSGEKYSMRYDADNPEKIEIDYWHPVFLPDEKTCWFIATIDKIHKKSFWNPTPSVEYSFEIQKKIYYRYVYLPFDFVNRYPNLKEGQHYELECLCSNPNRLVVHLDKPIKDTIDSK